MINVWKEGWGVCQGTATPGRGPEPGNDEVRGNTHLQRIIVHVCIILWDLHTSYNKLHLTGTLKVVNVLLLNIQVTNQWSRNGGYVIQQDYQNHTHFLYCPHAIGSILLHCNNILPHCKTLLLHYKKLISAIHCNSSFTVTSYMYVPIADEVT